MYGILVRALARRRGGVTHVECCRPLATSSVHLHARTVNKPQLKTSTPVATEKKLFTPGPLGISMTTKQAMLRDLGSRDTEFMDIVKSIRRQIVELAGVSPPGYTCVPMQGSGSFALESVLTTTVPKVGGKVLILENGAYGRRQASICDVLHIDYHKLSLPENEMVTPELVRHILQNDRSFTNVAVVHCETSSGVVNPIEELGAVVKELCPDAVFFVDAMSSFGGIPINMADANIDYLVTSANKCLEGVPGFSLAIARTEHLRSCKGNARSYSLDLTDQYEGLEKNGQFRFTPPTHAMLALHQALRQLEEEGGVLARAQRYKNSREVLRRGMSSLGFTEFLTSDHLGYIITSFNFPKDPNFDFVDFYERLGKKGMVIYPGKVLNADCFRIGNIGHLFAHDMTSLLDCIESVCRDMNLKVPLDS